LVRSLVNPSWKLYTIRTQALEKHLLLMPLVNIPRGIDRPLFPSCWYDTAKLTDARGDVGPQRRITTCRREMKKEGDGPIGARLHGSQARGAERRASSSSVVGGGSGLVNQYCLSFCKELTSTLLPSRSMDGGGPQNRIGYKILYHTLSPYHHCIYPSCPPSPPSLNNSMIHSSISSIAMAPSLCHHDALSELFTLPNLAMRLDLQIQVLIISSLSSEKFQAMIDRQRQGGLCKEAHLT